LQKIAGANAPELAPQAVDALSSYHWTGNVRQLRNCLERAVLLADNGKLRPKNCRPKSFIKPRRAERFGQLQHAETKENGTNSFQNSAPTALHEVEKQQIINALEKPAGIAAKRPSFWAFRLRRFTAACANTIWKLFDAEWQWTLENSPTFASYLGDKRYNDRWNDQSIDAIKKRNARRVEALAKLKRINRAELPDKEKVNYDLFQKDYESAIANFETRLYLLPINQRGGVQTSDELAEFIQFQTVKDYEDWIARLNAFPVLMEQNLSLMRAGKAEKMIWSRQVLTRVPAQIDKQIVASAEQSPFYAPFNQMSKDVPASEQTRLRKSGESGDFGESDSVVSRN
jgi:hypothetical protein